MLVLQIWIPLTGVARKVHVHDLKGEGERGKRIHRGVRPKPEAKFSVLWGDLSSLNELGSGGAPL